MFRLEHSPQTTGAFTHDGTDYRIEDGIIEVEDSDVAHELAQYRRIELLDVEETPTPEPEEPDLCGAEMTDGSICERPADECPYH